jgi:hypothetical protein
VLLSGKASLLSSHTENFPFTFDASFSDCGTYFLSSMLVSRESAQPPLCCGTYLFKIQIMGDKAFENGILLLNR